MVGLPLRVVWFGLSRNEFDFELLVWGGGGPGHHVHHLRVVVLQSRQTHSQGQDSRLKMRTFLKPASLGYKQTVHSGVWGGVEEGEGAD